MIQRPRILFVEGDDPASLPVHGALENHGFSVAAISNHDEEEPAMAFRPHAAIIDPELAAESQYSFLRRLKTHQLPCQLIVARTSDEMIRSARLAAFEHDISVLGEVDRPYATDKLRTVLGRLPADMDALEARVDSDSAFIQALIESDLLVPNLTEEFLPKYCLETNRLVGYELLTRLRNRRSVSPELIFSSQLAMDQEVRATLRAVDAALRLWRAIGRESRRTAVPISINCSASALVQRGLAQAIVDLVKERRVPAKALLIELTEDGRPVDNGKLQATAEFLARRKIALSMDDFGKGAANLDRLARLPFREVKIDKDIFRASIEGRLPRSFLEGIFEYCRTNAITAVVEGIETVHHLAFAKALGADMGQGFYWGRPIHPRILTAFY